VTVIGADGAYEAEAIAITDEGELRVRLDDGNTKDLFTGEVSIKI
jgi:biotin-(acetyl-CoA carboxylase) ligase